MPVLSALMIGLLLAGCASTRGLESKVSPQDADALSSSRSLSSAALSDAGFPRQDWWSALGDP